VTARGISKVWPLSQTHKITLPSLLFHEGKELRRPQEAQPKVEYTKLKPPISKM
jgi:hypothetical protein